MRLRLLTTNHLGKVFVICFVIIKYFAHLSLYSNRYQRTEQHVIVDEGDAKRVDFKLKSSVLQTWSKKEDFNIAENIAAIDISEGDIAKALEEIAALSDIATQSSVSVFIQICLPNSVKLCGNNVLYNYITSFFQRLF